MVYRLTPEAEDDMRDIYFAGADRFGVRAADAYSARITACLRTLADYPRLAHERRELNGVRVHPVGSHLVFYVVDEDDVLVVRVRHGREDWQGA